MTSTMILALVAATALSVRVDWMRGGAMQRAEVYGSRAAIWNDQLSVRLTAAELASLQRRLAGFEKLPEHFGEVESDFLKIRGKVTVNGKTVVQYLDEEQSEELAAMAAAVLTGVERAAKARGTGASSFAEALRKLEAGTFPRRTAASLAFCCSCAASMRRRARS